MKNTSLARFAICLKNKACEDLVVRKVYPILPDERAEKGKYLRVIDESTATKAVYCGIGVWGAVLRNGRGESHLLDWGLESHDTGARQAAPACALSSYRETF